MNVPNSHNPKGLCFQHSRLPSPILIRRCVYKSKKRAKIHKCMAANGWMCSLKHWFKEDHKPNEVAEDEVFHRWWFKANHQLWNLAQSSSWNNSECS